MDHILIGKQKFIHIVDNFMSLFNKYNILVEVKCAYEICDYKIAYVCNEHIIHSIRYTNTIFYII